MSANGKETNPIKLYTQDGRGSAKVIEIGVTGPGSVYLPSFASPRPLRKIRSASNANDSTSGLMSSADYRKPNLLTNVVLDEELDDIVKRLSRPTVSTRRKIVPVHPNLGHMDMDSYGWHNMKLYTDYQRTIFNEKGAVKPTYRKCCKKGSWM